MIISDSLKYVYLAVPKTASMSISKLLVDKYEGFRYGVHHNVVLPKRCLGYYKFCSVRNPYQRAISLFLHTRRVKEHRCHKMAQKSFPEYMYWTSGNEEPHLFIANNDFPENLASGEELERVFYQQSINDNNGRDLNQVEFISYFMAINYIEKMDYIIRLENLEQEFQKLPFFKKGTEIPKVNVSQNNWGIKTGKQVESYVYKWARDDFLAFNYGRIC